MDPHMCIDFKDLNKAIICMHFAEHLLLIDYRALPAVPTVSYAPNVYPEPAEEDVDASVVIKDPFQSTVFPET